MFQQDITHGVAVQHRACTEEVLAVALLNEQYLSRSQSLKTSGRTVRFLGAADDVQALRLFADAEQQVDVLIIDEDFFGSPEDAATICMQVRRKQPNIHIVAIESEMWDGESILDTFKLCQSLLPAKSDTSAILDKISSLSLH